MVAVSGGATPKVLHRERVELCPRHVERFVYHDIDHRGFALPEATAYVAKSENAIEAETSRVVKRVTGALGPNMVALVAEPRPLPELERILTAHPLWHAAEGELYRNALALAAAAHGLETIEVPPKRVRADAARVLSLDERAQDAMLAALGKALGPPWQRDHREATLAALIALASRS